MADLKVEKGQLPGILVEDLLNPKVVEGIKTAGLKPIALAFVKLVEQDGKKQVVFVQVSHDSDKDLTDKTLHISSSDPQLVDVEQLSDLLVKATKKE